MTEPAVILVANRGEIAVRIIRAVRELGHKSLLIVSEADQHSLGSRLADEVVVLPGVAAKDTYLNVPVILAAAKEHGATGVHPGFGFLSENAAFAKAVVDAGLVWVGPASEVITLMGDKAQAIQQAMNAEVPTVPGSGGIVPTVEEAEAIAAAIGYPVAIKASAGGGGKGIRVVDDHEALLAAWDITSAEAAAAFGDGSLYIEKFIRAARHVEVQVFGDGVNFVHLFERDCSMQRRHQKLMEECPAPGIPAETKAKLHESAVRLAARVNYVGAGTIEYLYNSDADEFYFIEMNTRIQVEHPITEVLLGVDLVREQISVALGAPLSFVQEELVPRGHVMEFRINAENPAKNFFPSPGTLTSVVWPTGPGVRIDAGVSTGDVIPPFYDSMIGKIIVNDQSRDMVISRAQRVLGELQIDGVKHTADFIAALVATDAFQAAEHHTKYLEEHIDEILATVTGKVSVLA